MQMPLNAPFLQVDGRALDCLTLVGHIKATAAKLGLDPWGTLDTVYVSGEPHLWHKQGTLSGRLNY